MCVSCAHTHSKVALHCLSSPPALVLFVDYIKQMVRKPITHRVDEWKLCVYVFVLVYTRSRPSPAGFSGVSCHPVSWR